MSAIPAELFNNPSIQTIPVTRRHPTTAPHPVRAPAHPHLTFAEVGVTARDEADARERLAAVRQPKVRNDASLSEVLRGFLWVAGGTLAAAGVGVATFAVIDMLGQWAALV